MSPTGTILTEMILMTRPVVGHPNRMRMNRNQMCPIGMLPIEMNLMTRLVDDPPYRMRTSRNRIPLTGTIPMWLTRWTLPVDDHPSRMARRWTQTLRAESKSMAQQDFVRSNPLNCLPVN